MEIVLGFFLAVLLGVMLRKVHPLILGAGVSAVCLLIRIRETYEGLLEEAVRVGAETIERAKLVATSVIAFEFVLFAVMCAVVVWLVRRVLRHKA
jgi:hypothetical protein